MSLSPLVWRNALLTFALSIVLGTFIGFIVFLPFFLSLIILLVMVATGIVFDLVGVAVAAADERPLHAMGADRVSGSGQAIWLVRRANAVANICNDVVGDVCGTISGAITVSLAASLAVRYHLHPGLSSILGIAAVAALTVGGKAFGKGIALKKPQEVIVTVGRILSWFGLSGGNRRRPKRNDNRRVQGRR